MFIVRRQDIFEDEPSLWNNFLSGNDEAFSIIYKRYAKRLHIQGLQFTSDKELIRDCVHDVFVRIYQNRGNLNTVNNIKIYLFIALRNNIISALKKHNFHLDGLDEITDRHITEGISIEEEYIDNEDKTNQQTLINKILSLLPIRQKEVIHYRFFEGMSLDEIAILMEMNYQSVQNLLQRSLKKINESLKIFEKR